MILKIILNEINFMNNSRSFICTILIVSANLVAFSQTPTQTIRGNIFEKDTGQPLTGATIQLMDSIPILGATSDTSGNFRIEMVPIGRFELEVRFVGYESVLIPEILVESGKEVVLNIGLSLGSPNLETVTVTSNGNQSNNISPVSTLNITIEETFRFPASFFDPARMALAFPGVVNDNDQANGLSIRGNSPTSLQWRLEGVEIVNPNHLSNAGTFSDRTAANAGGVNILSAQMLGNTTFMTSAFPSQYGNTLGGIMDMRLRSGNNETHEFTAQAGFLGFDVAAEGPVSKNSKASYLANYRYSFTGLLTAFGVDFGGEAISFQDLAVHLSFPFSKNGKLTLFGMGGTSKNIFEVSQDEWEEDKDRHDISFESKMGVLGATLDMPIGKQSFWKSTIAYSVLESDRKSIAYNEQFIKTDDIEDNRKEESKLSFSSILTHRFSKKEQVSFGVEASLNSYNLSQFPYFPFSTNQGINVEGDGWLLQPFVHWHSHLSKQLELNAGLHLSHFTLTEKTNFEPRLALTWKVNPSQKISFAWGIHSQIQLPEVYFLFGPEGSTNSDLDFTKSQHYVLSWKIAKRSSVLRAELFYQDLYDVPIEANNFATFSALNISEAFTRTQNKLSNDGTGRNYGLELSYRQFIKKGFYLLAGGALYESKFTPSDGIERDTRFNGNYHGTFTVGKEFQKEKKEKVKIFGMSLQAIYGGGFRHTPIDTLASEIFGYTVYEEELAFSQQLDDYYRFDVRVYWKWNNNKSSSMLSLDIQNVSNRINQAGYIYDPLLNDVLLKEQLGMIPFLTYRVEF